MREKYIVGDMSVALGLARRMDNPIMPFPIFRTAPREGRLATPAGMVGFVDYADLAELRESDPDLVANLGFD
jgi:hypothetical protein